MTTCRLVIKTHEGIQDLNRVLGVFALVDLTPDVLAISSRGSGLAIRASMQGQEPALALCVARIRKLVCVRHLDVAYADAPKAQTCEVASCLH